MVNNTWYRNGGGRENHQGHRSFSYRCSARRKTCTGRLCIWVNNVNMVIDKRATVLCIAYLDHSILVDNLNEVIVGQEWSQVAVFRRRSAARPREPENRQQEEEGMVNRQQSQEQVIEQRVEEEEIQIQLFRCPICDFHKTEWVSHGCQHFFCRRERIFLETYSSCFFPAK